MGYRGYSGWLVTNYKGSKMGNLRQNSWKCLPLVKQFFFGNFQLKLKNKPYKKNLLHEMI